MRNANLLEQDDIHIDDLLLDPNNPRFSKHLDERTPRENIADKAVQDSTYELMNHEDLNFQIDELVQAIMTDGYIHVDKIFVEKVGTKYLVIEGNRRVTAIKKILKNRNEKKKGFSPLPAEVENEILKIPCVIIDASKKGSREMIRKILGLRHHGSILPWKPLPAAFNLYEEYMLELCSGDINKAKDHNNFVYTPTIAKKVAATFSVKPADVRQKVKLYRIYLQLAEASNNDEKVISADSFSMIEETIGSTALSSYFQYNDQNSTFADDGVEKILDLYFGLRGQKAIITQASAGDSNVRDFAIVVSNGTPEDVDRVIKNRDKAGMVAADVKAKRSHRSLPTALELILEILSKINLGDIGFGFAPSEKEYISKIDKKMKQMKRAADLTD